MFVITDCFSRANNSAKKLFYDIMYASFNIKRNTNLKRWKNII